MSEYLFTTNFTCPDTNIQVNDACLELSVDEFNEKTKTCRFHFTVYNSVADRSDGKKPIKTMNEEYLGMRFDSEDFDDYLANPAQEPQDKSLMNNLIDLIMSIDTSSPQCKYPNSCINFAQDVTRV